MLDRIKHETTMRNILDEIYSHKDLSNNLGFKGGTACYFFYNLPRFSTDLDFNLLNSSKKEEVFISLEPVLQKYGEIKDKYIKENTVFFYLSHTTGKSGIKIEISTREQEMINSYDLIEFFGTSMLVMKTSDIFSNKLLALKHRPSATSRDLFDINFFFTKNWDINKAIIEEVAKIDFLSYMKGLPSYIKSNFNSKNIHLGIGELLETGSQRSFVKMKLIEDTINKINFFVSSYEKNKN